MSLDHEVGVATLGGTNDEFYDSGSAFAGSGFNGDAGRGADHTAFAGSDRPGLSGLVSRGIDIVFASLLLIAVLPILVLVAIALQLDSPGKLFFVQRRIGLGGVTFPCIKFRTMCENADEVLERHLAEDEQARSEWAADFKLRNDPRVTRLGAMVRRYSIDEFPQLINIIRGDMAVVGPRPIIASEIVKYSDSFAAYCSVKPGLTGLWQVSGRNNVSYQRRVMLDRFYVQRKSIAFDMKILALTVPAVLGARGSY
jgi:exopolysaccharide production protein ExoY